MIAVQQTSSNADKIVAGIVTSFFLLATFLLLHLANLPEVKQKTEIYEEINWTRFKPKPKKIFEQPKAPEPAKVKEPVKLQQPPPPAPKPNAIQKIDLNSLDVFKNQTLSQPSPTLTQKKMPQKALASSRTQTKINLNRTSLLSGMNTLTGQSSQRLKLPKSGSRGHGRNNAPALSAKSGSALSLGGARDYGSGVASLGAPQAKTAGTNSVQVKMVDMASMEGNFEDLSPIYRALVEWMKRHPRNLPRVVKRFMEHSPGDLTTSVHFQINGRDFEMYILCKVSLYEIRVCLLEGKQSTYLIDRGFKEKSSYLRVGTVNLTPTGKILSFGTTRRQASDHRTQEFYQVFLSWWEIVKSEVQQYL